MPRLNPVQAMADVPEQAWPVCRRSGSTSDDSSLSVQQRVSGHDSETLHAAVSIPELRSQESFPWKIAAILA